MQNLQVSDEIVQSLVSICSPSSINQLCCGWVACRQWVRMYTKTGRINCLMSDDKQQITLTEEKLLAGPDTCWNVGPLLPEAKSLVADSQRVYEFACNAIHLPTEEDFGNVMLIVVNTAPCPPHFGSHALHSQPMLTQMASFKVTY